MVNSVRVVNIKCGGCKSQIIETLQKAGAQKVEVNVEKQTVSFEGNRSVMCKKLSAMGYPEASSEEAKSVLKKARSFLSCAIGKTKK